MLRCSAAVANIPPLSRFGRALGVRTVSSMEANIVRSDQDAQKVERLSQTPPPPLPHRRSLPCRQAHTAALPFGVPLQIAIQAKRVAVLGIKTEAQASQPAFFVPE